MTRSAQASTALLTGSVAILVTMGLHPSGADIVHNANSGVANTLVRVVHGLALVAMPMLLSGTAWLSWCLRDRLILALTAWTTYLLAVCAVSVAAVASGFIAPAAAARAADATGNASDVAMHLFHYTGTINQAFAKVFVGLSALAITFWSAAMRGHSAFPRGLSLLGIAVGGGLGLALLGGRLRLDVHGFGAVMIAQSIWTLWAAACLRRIDPND